jgi:hypothetical protein
MRGQEIEDELRQTIAGFRHDPLGFVQFAFPWGVKDGPLAHQIGPMQWQAEELIAWGNTVRSASKKGRHATASGKGIGKSCTIAMGALWALATFPDTKVLLTAGTEPQLRTKLMPEVAKWYRMCICRHWFNWTNTSLASTDPDHEKTWRLDAIPWNEKNPEAFAGLHNQGKRIVVIFDEASQIADSICETTDTGIFTDADTEVLWAMYGNPTRGDGFFRECFESRAHRWNIKHIDSRDVPITDKENLAEYVEDYGEDSDLVRTLIRGLFPRVSDMQFIGQDMVLEARKREVAIAQTDPLILGVDVARFGQDESVLALRKGRDARIMPWVYLQGQNTVAITQAIMSVNEQYKPDAIHIDGGGVGGGVIDQLRAAGVPNVREVQFGAKPDRAQLSIIATRFANKRAEMWGIMKEAMPGTALPDDQKLQDQLTSVLYGYKGDMEILLEKKEHMKARGMPSPDRADALALTYAYPVLPRATAGGPANIQRDRNMARMEYDLHA